MYCRSFGILILLFSCFSYASPNCPQTHCSQISVGMNDFCIANGMKGKPYLVFSPSGGMCYCPCSCVSGDTLIDVSRDESVAIKHILSGDQIYSPLSLSENIVENPMFSEVENGTVIEIEFENGSTIKASENHTFVTPSEKMISAKGLKVGDQVLGRDRNPVAIVSLNVNNNYSGDLRNLIINGSSTLAKDHLVVTNGILSGDWLLQTTNDQVEFEIGLRSEDIIILK